MEDKMKIMKKTNSKIMGEEVPWYFTPKKGSVIPKNRKLVKRMIFDQALHFCLSLCHPSDSKFENDDKKNKRKKILVFPASG